MKTLNFQVPACGAMLLIALSVQAQDSQQSGASAYLPPVVVTSKGQEENYLELPTRVDRVKEEHLKKDRVRFVGESMTRVSGVQAREMNPLIPAIGIRTPANTNSPYWLATHDSLPVMPPVNYSHETPTRMMFSAGAKNFEVLKGASSVLYGADAISAVVNLKSPEPSQNPKNSFGVEGGERAFSRFKLSSSRWINEKNGYAFSANSTSDSGWRDTQSSQRAEGLLSFVKKLDGNDKVTTTLLANTRRSNEAGYLTKAEFDANPEKSGNASGLDFYRRNTYARLSSEWKLNLESGRVLTLTPYLRTDNYDIREYWSTTMPESSNQTRSLAFRANYLIPAEESETNTGVDFDGTYFDRRKEQTLATVPGAGGNATKDNPRGVHYDYRVTYLSVSPYANHSWFFKKDWRLDVGLRGTYAQYSYENKALDGTCDSTNNTSGACGMYFRVPSRIDSFTNASPKLGLNYQLSSSSSLFTNVGTGFKIPGASTFYEIKVTEKAPTLQPEKSLGYELGYKYDDNLWGADLSVYRLEISDRIVRTQGVANELATAVNAGKSMTEGFEFSTRYSPMTDLTLSLNGTFKHSKFIEYKSSGVDYSGKAESQAPNQLYDVRVEYKPGYLSGLWIEAELQRMSGYWVEDANTNFQDGHDIYNLKLEYEVGSLNANVKLMNATNTKFAADASNSGTVKYRPGMPRTLYAGLEYNF